MPFIYELMLKQGREIKGERRIKFINGLRIQLIKVMKDAFQEIKEMIYTLTAANPFSK